jgi:hypothetical protein
MLKTSRSPKPNGTQRGGRNDAAIVDRNVDVETGSRLVLMHLHRDASNDRVSHAGSFEHPREPQQRRPFGLVGLAPQPVPAAIQLEVYLQADRHVLTIPPATAAARSPATSHRA